VFNEEKSYKSPQEEAKRKSVFAQNLEIVNKHNADGKSSYTLAMNHLADLTAEEFTAMLNGAIKPDNLEV
jgi:hypothetical protein